MVLQSLYEKLKKTSQNFLLRTFQLGAVGLHSKKADLIFNICGLLWVPELRYTLVV